LMPEADLRRCGELGAEIRRRFSRPLAETRGQGDTVDLTLPKPARVDHVVLQEDTAAGERVRKYAVEGLVSGETWQMLCEGTSIGHKRIERFAPVEVAKVRFRAVESVGGPGCARWPPTPWADPRRTDFQSVVPDRTDFQSVALTGRIGNPSYGAALSPGTPLVYPGGRPRRGPVEP